MGVYVQSESLLKTSDIDGKFSQDFVENIATISAGITKLEVLDEKWDGETFWMRASITVDNKSLEESLRGLSANKQKLKELNEVKQKLNEAVQEIEALKREVQKNGDDQLLQSKKYRSEINVLIASDFLYNGVLKAELHDFNGAIEEYSKAIEIDPQYGKAYYDRGTAKAALEDFRGAIMDFNKAIEIDAENLDAYVNRGNSKAMLNDLRGAIFDFSKAIEIDPKDAFAYNNRGLAKLRLGQKYNGCLDLSKAGELGHKRAYDAIKRFCK